MDRYGKRAGKGPLIAEDISNTIGTSQDQYLFQPILLDDQGGSQMTVRTDGKCGTLRAEAHGNLPCVLESVYAVTAKGNGDAFLNEKTHTSLSAGGGCPGQGYPCVLTSYGFKPLQGSKAQGMGWEQEKAPTIIAGNTGGGY